MIQKKEGLGDGSVGKGTDCALVLSPQLRLCGGRQRWGPTSSQVGSSGVCCINGSKNSLPQQEREN